MVLNKWNVLISLSAALTLGSCSNNHAARMEKLRAEHENKYRTELKLQQDSLRWADSVLVEITPVINDMIEKGNFEFVKNEFDEYGRFVTKGADDTDSHKACYLYAVVTEFGQTQLISKYHGNVAFGHTHVVLEGGDGTVCRSKIVPTSLEGANYRFENQGIYHDIVTFANDNELLAYIDMHRDDSKLCCVQYNDYGKQLRFIPTKQEQEQISDAYRLGCALALQLHCSQMSKVSADKITLLKSKLDALNKKDNNL
ncbi:MAG: hypothetical protein Q4B58_03285 [Bacteroidales bacterium]|nr:hypothetical protein [Bacteroidales bacterium]